MKNIIDKLKMGKEGILWTFSAKNLAPNVHKKQKIRFGGHLVQSMKKPVFKRVSERKYRLSCGRLGQSSMEK